MIPCKEVVRTLSSGKKLSLIKRLEIRLHLAMCEHCSTYAEYLKKISKYLQKHLVRKKLPENHPPALERKILDILDNKKSPPRL